MPNAFFYAFSISFFIGVFVASFAAFSMYVFVAAAVVAIFAAIIFHKKKIIFICSIACLAFSLGIIRSQASQENDHTLDASVGKKISLSGIICAEPEERETGQRFCFQPQGSRDKIIVSVPKQPQYHYGDELSISATLKLPKNFQAYDGGPEFDYVSYLGKDDIRYMMSYPKIKKIAEGKGNLILALLIFVKSAFMDRVRRLVPEPQASLVGGLLLGENGALPQQISDDFKRSGLTHILVLSGSNVTVVAESLLALFAFLPKNIGRVSGAFSIVLFALMTGASSTTVRATIMALTHLFAEGIGRRYDVVRALILSAFVMIMQNPRILAFDISFQLSFLATIAVIFVAPLVKERLGFVTEKFAIRETLSMTIGTQIFTLPFILYKMGEISIVALIPNLLVLPIVPYAMLGGFVTGAVGLISLALAAPFGLATRLMLSYMLVVVRFFGELPFATIKTPVGAPFLFISYAVYTVILIFLWRRRSSLRSSPN